MTTEYELLYKKPKELSIKSAATSNKIDNLEKRMKYIKRQKCDSSWCNKSRLSPKIYDTWCSPLNEKSLKIDSACMHASKCDYQSLVELLFTCGELDPDKVLCLHVLASHPCEKLTLPANSHVRLENQTALEKLIERSRSFCGYRSDLNDRRKLNSINKHNKKYSTDSKIQDGRLATRLVINENLWRLVQTVIEALHHCNPAKMSYLLKIAQNGNLVRHIINKPQLQSFLKALTSQNIVLSSESFLLTRPFETCIQLRIDNPSHNLEVLIQKIRRRVLNDQNYDTRNPFNDLIYNPSILKMDDRFKRTKIKGEVDGCISFCNFDVEKISTILNTKIREAQEKDLKYIKKLSVIKPVVAKTAENKCNCKTVEPSNLRKSYCYACTENWRKNMISRNEKTAKNTIKDFEKNYKASVSRSTQWLKLIIREEEENLTKLKSKTYKPYRNRTTELVQKKPMVLNVNGKKKFQKMAKISSNDADTLNTSYAENNLNLAKIKNEISTKENKKRIKKFLEQPIYAARKIIVEDDYNIISI